MRNEIIEKAQEIGKMIADSEENNRLAAAAEAMNNDEEATAMLRTYNENRKTATESLREKDPTKEDLDNYRNYVQAEFEKIVENKLIAEYIEASKEFDLLVNQVNAVMSYFITGQEQVSAEGGCSGNCSSCSSCH